MANWGRQRRGRSRSRSRRSNPVTEKKAKNYYMKNKKKLVLPVLVTMIAGHVGIPKIKPYLSKMGINIPF